MKEKLHNDIQEATKRNLYNTLTLLEALNEKELIDTIVREIIGSIIISLDPIDRVGLKLFIDELFKAVENEVFEDDEDISMFIKEEFGEEN